MTDRGPLKWWLDMISKGKHHGLILTGRLLSFAQMFGVPWQQFPWNNIIWGWTSMCIDMEHPQEPVLGVFTAGYCNWPMVWTWFDINFTMVIYGYIYGYMYHGYWSWLCNHITIIPRFFEQESGSKPFQNQDGQDGQGGFHGLLDHQVAREVGETWTPLEVKEWSVRILKVLYGLYMVTHWYNIWYT